MRMLNQKPEKTQREDYGSTARAEEFERARSLADQQVRHVQQARQAKPTSEDKKERRPVRKQRRQCAGERRMKADDWEVWEGGVACVLAAFSFRPA